MTFRSFLYSFAKALGDINAVQKNRVPQRIGRRIVGRMTGKLLSKLFK
jgi:hypothetical protein